MQSTQHRNSTIPHLLYTGDLQLIGEKQMQAVRTCSDDIHMELGLDKCARIVLNKRKLVHSQNLILDFSREMCLNREKHMST
jgi:hypothetical protein